MSKVLLLWQVGLIANVKLHFFPTPTHLRMYCIDTGAIAFMFNGGSSCGPTIHLIDTKPITNPFLKYVFYPRLTATKYAQNIALWHPGFIYAVHP